MDRIELDGRSNDRTLGGPPSPAVQLFLVQIRCDKVLIIIESNLNDDTVEDDVIYKLIKY